MTVVSYTLFVCNFDIDQYLYDRKYISDYQQTLVVTAAVDREAQCA